VEAEAREQGVRGGQLAPDRPRTAGGGGAAELLAEVDRATAGARLDVARFGQDGVGRDAPDQLVLAGGTVRLSPARLGS
jgi:hypothetical protein